MDKKLQLIRHLYGEAEDPADLQQLLEEPGLKDEHKALSEVKFWLDHAKKERPDMSVLEAVRQAAAGETAAPVPPPPRTDRPPASRSFSFRRRFGAVASVLSLLAAVGVGYSLMSPANSPTAASMENAAPAAAQEAFADRADADQNKAKEGLMEAEAEEIAPSVAAETFAPQPQAGLSLAGLSAGSDTTVPDWDDVDDLLLYKRRIEMLLEQSQDLTWDEPVPLEMLPASRAPNSGLIQARSRTSTGNQ